MGRLFGNILLLASMFVISGGHLLLTQSVGWATMLLDYSREMSLPMAIEQTFRSTGSCKFCKAVETGAKDQSQLPMTVKSEKKADVYSPTATPVLGPLAGRDFSYPPNKDSLFPPRGEEPPTPVPLRLS